MIEGDHKSGLVAGPQRAAGFWGRLDDYTDATALITQSGETISYARLAAMADQWAAKLGASKRLVMLECANEVESVVAYLGALRNGHPIILSGPGEASTKRIREIFAPDVVYAKTESGWSLEHYRERPAERTFHPDLALLLSTSGSTGAPKLVRLSHGAIAANACSIAEYLDIQKGERAITSLPMQYSFGMSVINSHLAVGATIVLTEHSVVDAEFWKLIEAEKVQSLAGVPYTYELLEQRKFREETYPHLKTLTQAGGRLDPATILKYDEWAKENDARFFVMYGQTEAAPRMAYVPPEQLSQATDCIGVPVPGGSIDILDEDGNELAQPEQAGELVYRGPNVMMGYAYESDDLARGQELDKLVTGDLAVRTEAGFFRIVGRKSRFVKPFGLRVSLDEIEEQLGRMGHTAMATGNDELIAIRVAGDAETDTIGDALADRYELPRPLFDVSSSADLPLLSSGKKDYRTVMVAAEKRREERAAASASMGFAQVIGSLVRKPDVSSKETFSSLGGDSLSYVNAAMAIESRLGYLPRAWDELTFSQLDDLTGKPAASTDSSRWFSRIDTEIVLRALAIMAVVLMHAHFRLFPGGSDALMILAGFTLARFHHARVPENGLVPVFVNFLKRVMLPYYLILIVYGTLNKSVTWPSWLLISNFYGRFSSFLTPFWFIEALFYCMAFMALLAAIKPIRRIMVANPLGFGLVLLVLSVIVRAAVFQYDADHIELKNFSTESVLPLFLAGWVFWFCRTGPLRYLALAIAFLLSLFNSGLLGFDALFGGWPYSVGLRRAIWIISVPALLLFLPSVKLPRLLVKGLTIVASISFTLYLLHMLPVHFLRPYEFVPPVVTLIAAIILAWIVQKIAGIIWKAVVGTHQKLRNPKPGTVIYE